MYKQPSIDLSEIEPTQLGDAISQLSPRSLSQVMLAATQYVPMLGTQFNTDDPGRPSIYVHPYPWTAAGATLIPVFEDAAGDLHIALVHNRAKDQDRRVLRLPEGYMHPKGNPELPGGIGTQLQANDAAEIKIAFQGVSMQEAYAQHPPVPHEPADVDLEANAIREGREETSLELTREQLVFLGKYESDGTIHSICAYYLVDLNHPSSQYRELTSPPPLASKDPNEIDDARWVKAEDIVVKEGRCFVGEYEIDTSIEAITDDPVRKYFETSIYFHSTAHYLAQPDRNPHKRINALLEKKLTGTTAKLFSGTLTKEDEPNEIIREFCELYLAHNQRGLYSRFDDNADDIRTLVYDFIALFTIGNKVGKEYPLNIYGAEGSPFKSTNRGKEPWNKFDPENPQAELTKQQVRDKKSFVTLNAGSLRSRDPSILGATRLPQEMPTWGYENSRPVSGASFTNGLFGLHTQSFVNSISGTLLVVVRTLLHLHENNQLIPGIYSSMDECMDHLKAMIGAVGYISGGHSLYEYLSVLDLPRQYKLDQDPRLQDFVQAMTEQASVEKMFGSEPYLDDVFKMTMEFNQAFVAKKQANAEVSKRLTM